MGTMTKSVPCNLEMSMQKKATIEQACEVATDRDMHVEARTPIVGYIKTFIEFDSATMKL